MEQAWAVFTGENGTFVVDSVRNLVVFRKTGWYSVGLSFERTGYEQLVTNYTSVNATNTVKGEPVVNAGDILLRPLLSK